MNEKESQGSEGLEVAEEEAAAGRESTLKTSPPGAEAAPARADAAAPIDPDDTAAVLALDEEDPETEKGGAEATPAPAAAPLTTAIEEDTICPRIRCKS